MSVYLLGFVFIAAFAWVCVVLVRDNPAPFSEQLSEVPELIGVLLLMVLACGIIATIGRLVWLVWR